MPDYYNYQINYPAVNMLMQMGLGITAVAVVFASLFGLAFYVIKSYGVYKLASRRGIRYAWLAWIPLGRKWIIGCIADQYQYVSRGRIKNRRTLLVILAAVSALFSGIASFGGIVTTVSSFLTMAGAGSPGSYQAFVPVFASGMVSILNVCVSLTATVFYFICLYDLYASCEPQNATLYIVLSIILHITEPFFILACWKKDGGMPPRRPVSPQADADNYSEN